MPSRRTSIPRRPQRTHPCRPPRTPARSQPDPLTMFYPGVSDRGLQTSYVRGRCFRHGYGGCGRCACRPTDKSVPSIRFHTRSSPTSLAAAAAKPTSPSAPSSSTNATSKATTPDGIDNGAIRSKPTTKERDRRRKWHMSPSRLV